ncbi:Neprilysin-11 [Dirofilaria immitis]|nr:Neprilysin-11 [Dirofilaria immitis]
MNVDGHLQNMMARNDENESQMQLISMEDSNASCIATPSSGESPPLSMALPMQHIGTNDVHFTPPMTYKTASGKPLLQWWRRRTSFEQILILLTFLMATTIIILLALFLPLNDDIDNLKKIDLNDNNDNDNMKMNEDIEKRVCLTKGCVQAANNLLMAMNFSANPCDNFFEYACGQWNRDHMIPDDMFAYALLESDIASNSRSIEMTRIAYQTCMNTSKLELLKSEQLLWALRQFAEWPLLSNNDKWNDQSFDLTNILATSRRYFGNEIFFKFMFMQMLKIQHEIRYTFLDQGVLGLGRGSRDYYLNASMFAKHLNAYKKYQFDVIKLLLDDANVTYDLSQLITDLDNLIDFETKFAEIVVPEDDRRNSTRLYNVKTISDLYTLLPEMEWLSFFYEIAPPSIHSSINNNTQIIVGEIDYMYNIGLLINNNTNHLLANYIFWRIVHSWVKTLDGRYEDIKQVFLRVLTGQQTKSPRWKECAQGTINLLPLAGGALYVREHFDSTDKQEALQMIANLQEAFKELVDESDWMDDKTKKVAVQKAISMINNIGYPDFINNYTALDEHYERLNFTIDDSYFDLLRKSSGCQCVLFTGKNALTFPAGILKPPFFSGTYPKMVNYGAIGAVIGHEITHGFDDQGSQYDKEGNLLNWWNADSYDGFSKRKECIINQYSSYVIPNTDYRVNGKLTQGENIADNGGAYKKYVKQLGHEEPHLPGFQNFSNDQIFFLSYAHFWCGHKKEAAALQQVLIDEHSPEIFRVIGVLSNLPEFSKAYNCPEGSQMNPSRRCTVCMINNNNNSNSNNNNHNNNNNE